MPIKKIVMRPHSCPVPSNDDIKSAGWWIGTEWECDCGVVHVLKEDQRDGFYWERQRQPPPIIPDPKTQGTM